MTITVVIGEPPYGKERVYSALRFALAARFEGDEAAVEVGFDLDWEAEDGVEFCGEGAEFGIAVEAGDGLAFAGSEGPVGESAGELFGFEAEHGGGGIGGFGVPEDAAFAVDAGGAGGPGNPGGVGRAHDPGQAEAVDYAEGFLCGVFDDVGGVGAERDLLVDFVEEFDFLVAKGELAGEAVDLVLL